MKFTGERVVVGDMKKYISTLQQHIARYNFALQFALNKNVLDAACGTGYGCNILQEATSSLLGVDIDEETINYSKKLYCNLDFKQYDLNKEFPTEKFDLCISFETIEHLEKPEIFLQNVSNNCEEFLFSIPINNPSKYHIQVWNKEEIINMINKYWSKINWYHQSNLCIHKGIDNAIFIIGYATK